MPVAEVEHQESARFRESVAAIRLTQQALIHLTVLAGEAERSEKQAALAAKLHGHQDATAEHSVLRSPASAGHARADTAVLPVLENVSETCLRWLFEEHCWCLGTP